MSTATKKKTTSKKAKASKPKTPATTTRQKPAAKRSAPTETTGRPRDPRFPAVGCTMTRRFRGKAIEVKVLADGFEYEGTTYASVSACAKAITGYGISGIVFFFGSPSTAVEAK